MMVVSSTRCVPLSLFSTPPPIGPADTPPQAPLLLAFFTTLPSSPIVTILVYILLDVFSALALITIASTGISVAPSNRKEAEWPPWAIAAAFLFNPFTIATCLARPTVVFTNTAILTAISKAVRGNGPAAVLALAMASYLSLYPVLLLPPMILLSWDSLKAKAGSLGAFAVKQTVVFAVAAAGLGGLSWLITGGSWEFLASTYGVHLLLPDLTPNVGLWWYFFIEMFDSFRNFFLCVFQLHLAVYVGGLCIRLRYDDLYPPRCERI